MRIGLAPARDEDRLRHLSSPPERRLARLLPCRRADDAAAPCEGQRRTQPPAPPAVRDDYAHGISVPSVVGSTSRRLPIAPLRTARWIIVDVRSEPSSAPRPRRRSSRSALDMGVGRLSSGSVLDRLCDHDVGRRLHRNGGAVTGRPTHLDRKQPPPLRASRARARARTRSGDAGEVENIGAPCMSGSVPDYDPLAHAPLSDPPRAGRRPRQFRRCVDTERTSGRALLRSGARADAPGDDRAQVEGRSAPRGCAGRPRGAGRAGGNSGRQPDTRVGARGPALVDLASLALLASAGDRPLAVARRSGIHALATGGSHSPRIPRGRNFAALGLLVMGLVTASTATLSGEELLLTGFGIWATNVIVFGLLFWELEAGGPVAHPRPGARDARLPVSTGREPAACPAGWSPQVWDYLYVSLTNSIAFSPTDAMPLSLRAKAAALESVVSAGTVLLVAARAVNVLGG